MLFLSYDLLLISYLVFAISLGTNTLPFQGVAIPPRRLSICYFVSSPHVVYLISLCYLLLLFYLYIQL